MKLFQDIYLWWLAGQFGCPTPKCSCYRLMVGQQAANISIQRWPRWGIENAAGWWWINAGWLRFNFRKSDERCRQNFIEQGRGWAWKSRLQKTKIASPDSHRTSTS